MTATLASPDALDRYRAVLDEHGGGAPPETTGSGDLWRELLRLDAVQAALAFETPAPLAAIAPLAEALGASLAAVPLIEVIVAVRLLGRAATPAAAALARRVTAGEATVAFGRPEGTGVLAFAGPGVTHVVHVRADALVSTPATDAVTTSAFGTVPMTRCPVDGSAAAVLAEGGNVGRLGRLATAEWQALVAAAQIGVMDAALRLGVAHAKQRVQFDAPIGSFQAVAHRLADAAVLTEASRALVTEALPAFDDGSDDDVLAAALTAFVHAADAAPQVAESSLHVHGGRGVMATSDIGRYLRQAKAWALAGGRPHENRLALGELVEQHGPEHDPSPVRRGHDAFRHRARQFFAGLLHRDEPVADVRVVLRELASAGLLGLTWSAGAYRFDLEPAEVLVVAEEATFAGFELTALTTTMNAAKTLAAAGHPALIAEVLPKVAAGEAIVSLGFSEAEAGSDVAAVRTAAVRQGDFWIITGEKLFTSRVQLAEYVFLLARTDPEARKRHGLTMFLIPVATPGITIAPIELIYPGSTAATVYDGVVVPDTARVGEVNGGWDVMRVALDFEHGGGSVPGRALAAPGQRLLRAAWTAAREETDRHGRVLLDDPCVRDVLVRHLVANRASRALEWSGIERARRTGGTGALASVTKLQAREAFQRACADVVGLFGAQGAVAGEQPLAVAGGRFAEAYLASQASTIYGGTSEIQRTIIAEQWLGLPRGNRR